MLVNAICYETKKPTIYNRGTSYESSCNQFLYKYGYQDDKATKEMVDALNQKLEEGVTSLGWLDLTTIKRFFVVKQEEMY